MYFCFILIVASQRHDIGCRNYFLRTKFFNGHTYERSELEESAVKEKHVWSILLKMVVLLTDLVRITKVIGKDLYTRRKREISPRVEVREPDAYQDDYVISCD